MILGYIISGEFNDSYMFNQGDENLPICEKCGYVTDFEYINQLFNLKLEKFDFSATYDGRIVVSEKFKFWCDRNKYGGLEFRELPNNKGYYHFLVRNVLAFDTEKVQLNYESYCDICGNYKSVTPAIPVVIKKLKEPLEDGIYCTDIHFASGNEKSPLIIVGLETYKKMNKGNFRGIHFLKFDTEMSVPWE